MNNLRVLRVIS